MADMNFVIAGFVLLAGIAGLGIWIFRKILNSEGGASPQTVFIALLLLVLLVPFAMNLSSHLVYEKMQRKADAAEQIDQPN